MTDTKPVFTEPFVCFTNPDTGVTAFRWTCLECGGELGYYGDNIDGAREMFASYAPRHETHGGPEINRRLDTLIERSAQVVLDSHAHVTGTVPLQAAELARVQAEDLARAGLVAGVSPHHAWTYETVAKDSYGVHSEHCCTRHGCKYFYRYGHNCPVSSGLAEQRYPCEHCEDDATDLAIDTARGK